MSDDYLFDIEIEIEKEPLKKPKNTKNIPNKKDFTKKAETNRLKKAGYRPVLVNDQALLETESIELEPTLQLLRDKHTPKQLSDQDLVALYMIAYLNQRYPIHFLENCSPIQKHSASNPRPESATFKEFFNLTNKEFITKLDKYKAMTLYDIVNNFNLHSVPHSARTALIKWYSKDYNLILQFDTIPTTRQVLAMQSEGKRCVSLITKNINKLIMDERDALSFLLHDLVHAYKMFSDDSLLKGQIGFSIAMMKLIKSKQGNQLIDDLIQFDSKFNEEFDYLISDMNSHPKHLFHYFKAILINAFKVKYNLSNEVLNGESLEIFQKTFDSFLDIFEMSDDQKSLARKMLMPYNGTNSAEASLKGFNIVDFTLIDEYFMKLYSEQINQLI